MSRVPQAQAVRPGAVNHLTTARVKTERKVRVVYQTVDEARAALRAKGIDSADTPWATRNPAGTGATVVRASVSLSARATITATTAQNTTSAQLSGMGSPS